MFHKPPERPALQSVDCRHSTQLREPGLHLGAGVLITHPPGNNDAGAEDLPGFLGAGQAGQELSVVKIAGHVIWVSGYQLPEMFNSGAMVAAFRTLQR